MLAFHSNPNIKSTYLARVRRHREWDEILQGYGYWSDSDGKGCGVGCTVHTSENPHKAYEIELGIPAVLAYLEDVTFEKLPAKEARLWPVCREAPLGNTQDQEFLTPAEKELENSGPSNEELLAYAKTNRAPQEWYNEKI